MMQDTPRVETAPSHPASSSKRSLVRDIVQKSGLYFVTIIAYRLVSLILFPIISRRLTPADYGTLDLLDQIGNLVSGLLGAGYSSSMGYFLHREDPDGTNPEGRGRVVATIFSGSFLLGGVVACVGLLAAPFLSQLVLRSREYTPYLDAMFLAIPLTFLTEACLGWLRLENRATQFVNLSLLRIGVTFAGILLLVGWFRWRIWGVLSTNIFAASVLAVIGVVMVVRNFGIQFHGRLFREMLRFSLPLNVTMMALFTLHFGDRFILPRYRPMSDLGVYALAYKFGMLISYVHSAFDSYWGSQIYHLCDRADAPVLFGRLLTYMLTVLSFTALALLVTSRIAIHVLAAPAYWGAIALLPVILGAYFARAFGDFFRAIFYAKGKPAYDSMFNWVGAGITLACYLLLIPRYGTMGAASATALGFASLAVLCPLGALRLFPYHLEKRRLLKLGVVTGALVAAFLLIPDGSVWREIGQGAGLLAAFPVLLLLLRFPHPGELEALATLRDRVRARLGA